MNAKQLAVNQLQASKWLFDNFIKDFSEADARRQPCEGGNHLNWILVHLAVSEDSITASISGGPKRYAEALHKAYGGGSACKADDGMTLAEARRMYDESHARTLDFIGKLPDARLADKAPEGMPPLFPTVGAVLGLLATHPFWHFGQLTVTRAALKKPRVF